MANESEGGGGGYIVIPLFLSLPPTITAGWTDVFILRQWPTVSERFEILSRPSGFDRDSNLLDHPYLYE